MGTTNPYFGNRIINIALTSAGAFPTALTAWDGSSGNVIVFTDVANDGSSANIDSTRTVHKTNDNKPYAISQEQEGITKGRLYNRGKNPVKWISENALTLQQAGQKILQIQDLGLVDGVYQEQFAIGDLVAKRDMVSGQAANDMYEFVSTPPSSAFTLSTANIAAIEAVGSLYSVRTTITVTIPTDKQDVIVYT